MAVVGGEEASEGEAVTLGHLHRADTGREALATVALLSDWLARSAGHVPIAVRFEVYEIRVHANLLPLWSWRAIDPEGTVVAESRQHWPSGAAVLRYLHELMPAAAVTIVLPD